MTFVGQFSTGFPGATSRSLPGSALDGPLGLTGTAEAVADQETAKQEAILQQYGFMSAYQRTWIVKGTGETWSSGPRSWGRRRRLLGTSTC